MYLGSTPSVKMDIFNIGTSSTQTCRLRVYLSRDSIASSDDFVFDTQNVLAMAPGTSVSRWSSQEIPSYYEGKFFMIAYIDYDGRQAEENETNNQATFKVEIKYGSYDYKLSSVYTNGTTFFSGDRIQINTAISNVGFNSGGYITDVRYFISKDILYDVNDVYLSTQPFQPFTAGTTIHLSTEQIIPQMPSGSYYLLAIIDYKKTGSENMSDNLNYTLIDINTTPSVNVPSSGSASTTAAGYIFDNGGSYSNYASPSDGSLTVNMGCKGSIYIRFDELELATGAYIELYNGASIAAPLLQRINTKPANVITTSNPQGALTIRFYAPAGASGKGFRLYAGCQTGPTRYPDGSVILVDAPHTVIAGDKFVPSIGYSISTVPTSESYYEMIHVFSKDSIFSNDDIKIGKHPVNGNFTIHPELVLPFLIEPGAYYYIPQITYGGVPTASSQHYVPSKITVKEAVLDLQISGMTLLKPVVERSNTFFMGVTEAFEGNIPSGPHEIGYYLSSDAIYQSTDVPLLVSSVASLNNGEHRKYIPAITIPGNTPIGNYYLLAVSDPSSTKYEKYKSNNIRALAITVMDPLPDLTIVSAIPSTYKITPYVGFSLTYTEKNAGLRVAGSHYTNYYISKDSVYDVGDTKVSDSYCSQIDAGHIKQYNVNININQSFAAGKYYLLLINDQGNYIKESSEQNTFPVGITILPSSIDLRVSALSATKPSVQQGGTIYLNAKWKNEGNLPAGSHSNVVYLSKDSIYSVEDLPMFTFTTNLNSKEERSLAQSINIAKNTPVGSYFLVMVVDQEKNIVESNEGNNTRAMPIEIRYPNVDLALGSSSSPITLNPGATASVYTVIYNKGTEESFVSNQVSFFLSKDSLYDSKDTLLGTLATASISGNYHYTGSYLFNSLINFAEGNYYIISVVDADQKVVETNEDNNISIVKMKVNPYSVDLRVASVFCAKPYAAPNSNIAFVFTELNNGTSYSDVHHTGYYLSKDTTFSVDDVAIGGSSFGRIPGKERGSKSLSLTIPENTKLGDYYIVIAVDDSNQVKEDIEVNNTKAFAIKISPYAYDVATTFQSLSASTLTAGSSVRLHIIEKNTASLNMAAHRIGYYLSQDSLFSVADVLIGSSSVTALNKGDSTQFYLNLTIPAATAIGNYYFISVLDDENKYAESNENNNITVSKLAIVNPYIDLALASAPAMYTTVIRDGTNTLKAVIKNNGSAATGNYKLQVYISKDSLFDTEDREFVAPTLSSIERFGTYNYSLDFIASSSYFTVGTSYLLLVVDKSNAIAESMETNNWLSVKIEVSNLANDYEVLDVSGDSIAYAGASVNYSFTSQNNGNAYTTSGNTRFYLSKDSIYSSMDVSLNSYVDLSYTKGKPIIGTGSFVMPTNVAPGIYYIIAIITGNSDINLGNNNKATKIKVKQGIIDFNVLSISDTVHTTIATKDLTPIIQVQNLGSGYSSTHHIGYFVSKDSVWDSSDILMSYTAVAEPLRNSSIKLNPSIKLPANTSVGDYYLIVVSDYDQKIVETNEQNNSKAYAFKVIPSVIDISLSPNTNFDDVAPNYVKSEYFNVTNDGNIPSGEFSIAYYWSTDSLYDALDIKISTTTQWSLSSGTTVEKGVGYRVPANTVPGIYYIFAVADEANTTKDPDLSNNMAKRKVIVAQNYSMDPAISLKIDSTKLSYGEVISGLKLPMVVNTKNNGALNAGSYNISVYLSSDTSINVGDATLYYFSSSNLYGYRSVNFDIDPTIPLFLVPGEYYVIAQFSFTYQRFPTDIVANNKAIIKIKVKRPDVDLTLSKLKIGNPIYTLGTPLALSFEESNSGKMPCGKHSISYFLSTDTVYNSADVLMSSSLVAGTAPMSSTAFNPTFTFSTNVTKGKYYVLAVTDQANEYPENNENNNLSWVAVKVEPQTADLTIASVGNLPNSITAYESFLNVTVVEKNQSKTLAGGHSIGIYLSYDSLVSMDDLLLSTGSVASVAGNASLESPFAFNIPYGVSDGKYYLITAADYSNQVVENNDTNNNYIKEIYISSPMSDLLVVFKDYSEATVMPGATWEPTCMVRNSKPFPITTGSVVRYYLSIDQYINEDDVLLQKDTLLSMWKDTLSLKPILQIPTSINLGRYYVIASADHTDLVRESNESNNTTVVTINITKVTDLSSATLEHQISMYPNPSQGRIYFNGDLDGDVKVEILTLSGQLLQSFNYSSAVDVSDYASGLYLIKLRKNDKYVYVDKLLIAK